MTPAAKMLRTLVDVRPAERAPVLLMLLYGFLALTSYYVIKPVRNSIFLARVGADQLPLVYILTAVVVIAVMVVYSRYVDRIERLTLLLSSFAGLGVALLLFWWLLRGGSGFLTSGAFYVFGKIYPLFLVSQFWLVANLLFTTSQARRLFGPIGVGLILGGIAGSTVSGSLAETVGTANLLLASAAILVPCAAIVVVLAPRMGRAGGGSARLTHEMSGTALQLLVRSSHLRTIAVILGLTIVAGTLLDWQFNRAVEIHIVGEDAKTEFFGLFFAALNVVSVVVQFFLTGLVLRRFGLRVALLVLPVGLMVTSVGIIAVPGLVAATLAKGTEGSLRYSLDQATRELLFLPVPEQVKYKVKPLIDLGIYRGGTGIGGLLLLLLVNGMGLSIRWVAVVTVGVVVVWIVAAVRMRREFGRSLRRLVGVRDVRLEELILKRLNAETLRELRGVLRGGEPEAVEYALALLEIDPPAEMAEDVAALLDHESDGVRARAVALLGAMEAREFVDDVRPLLDDPALSVRAEVIGFLCALDSEDSAARMEAFLDEEDDAVRMAATGCLLRHGGDEGRVRGLELTRRLASSDDPADRRRAVKLVAQLPELTGEAVELLEELIRDEAVAVCHDAMEAAGRAAVPGLVPVLMERLCEVRFRGPAASALAAYGRSFHEELLDRLASPDTPPDVRTILPGLLLPDPSDATVERLVALLPDLGPAPRYEALKALNKLRRTGRPVRVEQGLEEAVVAQETEDAYLALVRADALDGEAYPAEELLLRTLEQRQREAVERALRTLALTRPAEDLYAAFEALGSRDGLARQRGFELLDTVLPQRYREGLGTLVDPDTPPERKLDLAEARFGLEPRSREDVLAEVMGCGDPWIALLAGRVTGDPRPFCDKNTLENHMRAEGLMVQRSVLPPTPEELMDLVERADVLRRSRVFRDLRTEDLAGIATLTREHSWKSGEVLFPEEAAGGTVHLVVEGRVEARKGGRVLFVAERGDGVGGLSLLDGLPTDYEAVACTESRTLSLDREDFQEILAERQAVVTGVVRYLTGVVRGLNRRPDGNGGAAGDSSGEEAGGQGG